MRNIRSFASGATDATTWIALSFFVWSSLIMLAHSPMTGHVTIA